MIFREIVLRFSSIISAKEFESSNKEIKLTQLYELANNDEIFHSAFD
jgi:hypothetical protein